MKSCLLVCVVVGLILTGCDLVTSDAPQSVSGVTQTTVAVPVGSDGLTAEQRNIKAKYDFDNQQGAVKYLYIVSAYSGQVLLGSVVDGKVTSSNKRLSPSIVTSQDGTNVGYDMNGIPITIGGRNLRTPEVLGDDGTYGWSAEYLFWKDTNGIYHQHYVSGGQIVHVSSAPMTFKSIVLTVEQPVASAAGQAQ